MLTIIATASASDEIDPWVWSVVWLGFILAAVLAFSALVSSIAASGRAPVPTLLSVAAGLTSLIPIAFAYHLYRIDFVAVDRDGTRASGPLWRALAWPAAPLLVALLAGSIMIFRQRRHITATQPGAANHM